MEPESKPGRAKVPIIRDTIEALLEDRERLDWLLRNRVYMAYSKDGDDCWLHWAYDPVDEERAAFNGPSFGTPRDAIDAARTKEKECKPR